MTFEQRQEVVAPPSPQHPHIVVPDPQHLSFSHHARIRERLQRQTQQTAFFSRTHHSGWGDDVVVEPPDDYEHIVV